MDMFYHEIFDISEQNPVQVYIHRGEVDYVIQEHWHEALEIDYLRQAPMGCGASVWINGRKHPAPAGSLVLINSGDIHALLPERVTAGSQEQVHGVSLFVSYEFLTRICPDFDNLSFCLEGDPAALDELKELFEQLVAQQTAPATQYGYLKLHALTLQILYILFTHFKAPKSEGVVSSRKYMERLRKVMDYMDQHYAEPLTLQQVSDVFCVSPSYLSRVFKTYTGHTFKTYLNQVRLNHALYQVIHTDYAMAEIAMRCGFPDTRSFNSLFKTAYDLTPLQYRKEYRHAASPAATVKDSKPFIRMIEK